MIPADPYQPILYACVARGATVVAELAPGGGGAAEVGRRCVAAAPRFHREYSHTAGGRIYAFAMADPLVLFALADASLGAPRALLFLRRLRRRSAAAPLSLQSELLPELRRVALALPNDDDDDDDPPPPPPPPSPPPPPPPPTPPNAPPNPGTEVEERKKPKKPTKKKKEKNSWDGADGAMEISVAADPPPKPTLTAWRRHLRAILLVDLAVCGLLFGIWISVCKGFHCLRR